MGGNLHDEGPTLFCGRNITPLNHPTATAKASKIQRHNSLIDISQTKHNREFKIQLGNSNLILLCELSLSKKTVTYFVRFTSFINYKHIWTVTKWPCSPPGNAGHLTHEDGGMHLGWLKMHLLLNPLNFGGKIHLLSRRLWEMLSPQQIAGD